MKDPGYRAKATEFHVKIQVVGTPNDCLQQLRELHRLTGLDHLVTEFAFGGMPHREAELNTRLFADRVMPALQRDPAFATAAGGARDGASRTAVPEAADDAAQLGHRGAHSTGRLRLAASRRSSMPRSRSSVVSRWSRGS